MSIGTLTVNVAANTPRANKALQTTASLIRVVGRSGEESGKGLSIVKTGLMAIASPAVAISAGKGLSYVGGGLQTIASSKSSASVGVLKHVGSALTVIGAPGAAMAAGRGLMTVGTGLVTIGRAGQVGGGLTSVVGSLMKIATFFIPGGTLIKLLALGGAALGIRAANTELNELVMRLDHLGKRSKRIGIGVPALEQLRYAGSRSGVDERTTDVALEKMNIRIAEAARGGGEAVNVLNDLGLSAAALNAMPTEQKFLAITRAMEGVTNQADKLRIATKLFEEEGAGLVTMMNLGEQGVRGLMTEASMLGGSTQAMTDAAEAYADATERANKTWGALADKIGATLLPLKTMVADISTFGGILTNAVFDAEMLKLSLPGKWWEFSKGATKDIAVNLATGFDPNGDKAGALTAEQDAHHKASKAAADKAFAKDELAKLGGQAMGLFNLGKNAVAGASTYKHRYRMPKIDGMAAIRQLQATSSGARSIGQMLGGGLNAATLGIPSLSGLARGKSAADDFKIGPVSDRINNLVDAGGSEGYMALRANQRTARLNPADKSAPKIETNTKKSADMLTQLVDMWKAIPKPRSA
jgi:hypothetical protein